MDRTPERDQTPSTAKAVGMACLIVGGFWLAFGGLMNVVLHTQQGTPVAQQLPPPDPTGKALQAGVRPTELKYKNIELVPIGEPQQLDRTKLAFLGQTDAGYGLWTTKLEAGGKARVGGGGGPAAPRGLPASTGPVYLRVANGTWLQVIQKGS